MHTDILFGAKLYWMSFFCVYSLKLPYVTTYTDNLYELSSFSTHWILHITWIVKGTVNMW